MKKELSVIIPAYNEEGNIEEAVGRCAKVLPVLADQFEVIVVNDGSLDQTGSLAERLQKSHESLRVFHHEVNKGMGAAVAKGFANARYDLLFATPADLQFDIAELEKLLPFIDQAEIVIGHRENRDYNWYRWMITYANIFLLRLLFGLQVKDPNWVKLFKRQVFQSISITSPGFFWDAEVLIKARKQNFRIVEVGVRSHPREKGKATGGSPKAALKTFVALMRFWLSEK